MRKSLFDAPVPEIWAGVECTVNRVRDQYNDQLECSGHANRVSDLDLFGAVGIRAMRYPVLWERMAPNGKIDDGCWSWADARMERLRLLGIRPIVGLLHHGSGPRHTSLVSPTFPDDLAEYARQVAERYPWVEEWTPINEPLTTARFSGLYGHWYPHGHDEQTFARALIQQCRATVLSMRAIRRINPAAQLIQTDDLGKVYSTRRLQYQADFENERRWLGWDLLCGLVSKDHRMWHHLRSVGIGEENLEWFRDNPCPPDIIGINHYLTSERFIDERLELYPPHCYGANGDDRYADVEAVRVLTRGTDGLRGVLQDAWKRYGRPLAITEAHLGCTREEQMRWLMEVWDTSCSLRRDGIDIRAVTCWALLGSYEWNSLLTRSEGHYEPGAFDMRSGVPRATGLARLLRQLAHGEDPSHPVLDTAGWWRHPRRILYRSEQDTSPKPAHLADHNLHVRRERARPILITGARGTLGSAFARLCDHRNLASVALARQEMDIADLASVETAVRRYNPWAIVNAAGYTDVDQAESDQERCLRENVAGPALLATICARQGIALLTFSSDLAFNGRQAHPYLESDACTPMNLFGHSKVRAERSVQEIMPEALIVRAGALFGPWDNHNPLTRALEQLAAGQIFQAIEDVTGSPTYVPDLVHACLDLLVDGEKGIWHLASKSEVTWKEFLQMAAARAGLDETMVRGCRLQSLRLPAARPRYSALASERGQLLQPLDAALDCYLRDCNRTWSETTIEREHVSRFEASGGRKLRSRVAPKRPAASSRHVLNRDR